LAIYDDIDAAWTWDGDFVVSDKGDLEDTSSDGLQSLLNEIHTLIRSDFGDWENHPIHASNLSDFRGEPNNRQTAEAIEERLVSTISAAGLVSASDISVRVVPVHAHQVLILMRINAAATPDNNLEPGNALVVAFTYDSLEDSVFFLPPSETERQFLRS